MMACTGAHKAVARRVCVRFPTFLSAANPPHRGLRKPLWCVRQLLSFTPSPLDVRLVRVEREILRCSSPSPPSPRAASCAAAGAPRRCSAPPPTRPADSTSRCQRSTPWPRTSRVGHRPQLDRAVQADEAGRQLHLPSCSYRGPSTPAGTRHRLPLASVAMRADEAVTRSGGGGRAGRHAEPASAAPVSARTRCSPTHVRP